MSISATGILLGVVFGFAHAAYVFRVVSTSGGTTAAKQPVRAFYAAAWTLLLWLLFSTWLLLLWALGAILMLVAKWWR